MSDKTKDEPFLGSEQRREDRRKDHERRQEIRFEPEKDDRRKNPGRRGKDKDPWFRHGV